MNRLTVSPGVVIVCLMILLFMSTLVSTPAAAAADCVRVVRVSGQNMLTNTCGQCRSVQVVKDRAGNALPSLRTFRLNGGELFPLPFKGPGATRITSDANCEEHTAADEKRDQRVAGSLQRCVIPMRTNRGMVLANGCKMCRSVVVERRYTDGREIHKSYALEARNVLALADEGAVSAEIIHDEACRS